jgi:hypothetical protein
VKSKHGKIFPGILDPHFPRAGLIHICRKARSGVPQQPNKVNPETPGEWDQGFHYSYTFWYKKVTTLGKYLFAIHSSDQ